MHDPNTPNPFAPGPEGSPTDPPHGGFQPHSGGTGMFGALPVVSILLIVLGCLEILYGVFIGGFLAIAAFAEQSSNPAEAVIFQVVMVIFFTAIGAIGLLRVVAGVGGFKYRRWGVMMTACCVGLVTVFTCYCAPFSLVVGILGIIVLSDDRVRRAFELAKNGHAAAEIRQIITGR